MDPAEQAKSRVGSLVAGRFQLERVLGLGGMGAVYEALHTFTGRKVAVKLLHEDYAKLPTVSTRFLQEAKATIDLRHPSITEVLDAGQEADGTLYIVFELLVGESFASALRSTQLPFEERLTIFAHLFDALVVAHGRNMVHRDIKPENVFLVAGIGYPGRVKLIDFGIARRVTGQVGDGITKVGAVLGTPTYMSPEVMVGDPIDVSADLWSMGVMMYRAFSGRLPFRGDNLQDILRLIVTVGPPDLKSIVPGLPPPLAAMIQRSLDRDKNKRFQSAADMATALRQAAPWLSAPVPAPEPPRAAAPAPPPSPVAAPQPPPVAAAPQVSPKTKAHAWESALAEIEGEIAQIKKTTTSAPPPAAQKPSKHPESRGRASWLSRLIGKKGE